MINDSYIFEPCCYAREFTDVFDCPDLQMPKKRIQIVEPVLIRKTSLLYERRLIKTPSEAAQLARKLYRNFDKEYLYGVYLTTKGEPICIELLSIGTIDCSILSPRDIIKTALLSAAHGFIIFHNHPSGSIPEPSSEDINVTRRLSEAAKLMSVKLVDHIIVSDTNYVSLRERGIIT